MAPPHILTARFLKSELRCFCNLSDTVVPSCSPWIFIVSSLICMANILQPDAGSVAKCRNRKKVDMLVLPLKAIILMFYAIFLQLIGQHLHRILMTEHFCRVFLSNYSQPVAWQLWLQQNNYYFIKN